MRLNCLSIYLASISHLSVLKTMLYLGIPVSGYDMWLKINHIMHKCLSGSNTSVIRSKVENSPWIVLDMQWLQNPFLSGIDQILRYHRVYALPHFFRPFYYERRYRSLDWSRTIPNIFRQRFCVCLYLQISIRAICLYKEQSVLTAHSVDNCKWCWKYSNLCASNDIYKRLEGVAQVTIMDTCICIAFSVLALVSSRIRKM